MSDENVKELPVNVDLDLDAEDEGYEPRPPYQVRIGGKVISLTDPEEIDWQDLMDVENPVNLLRYALNDEDRTHLYGLGLPARKLTKLVEGYMKHFGMDEKMRQYERMQRAGAF